MRYNLYYTPIASSFWLWHCGFSVELAGFQTALQYMVEGDDWYVYIPQQMAYGSEPSDVIPAYSTLLFRINVVGVYENKNDIPDWK